MCFMTEFVCEMQGMGWSWLGQLAHGLPPGRPGRCHIDARAVERLLCLNRFLFDAKTRGQIGFTQMEGFLEEAAAFLRQLSLALSGLPLRMRAVQPGQR